MSDFFPQHPKVGEFESLKGRALTPPELPFDVQDHNDGPDRLNQEVTTGLGSWDSHVIVTTGLTHGGGTMAK